MFFVHCNFILQKCLAFNAIYLLFIRKRMFLVIWNYRFLVSYSVMSPGCCKRLQECDLRIWKCILHKVHACFIDKLHIVKDTMSASFMSELFTSYIWAIFKQWNLIPKIWETAKSMHVKILQKNELVENVWPANSALFI